LATAPSDHTKQQRNPKMKNPPAWASGGGLRFLGAEVDDYLEVQPPHTRRHEYAAFTATKERGLP